MVQNQGKTQSYYASHRVQEAFEEMHGAGHGLNRSKYLNALVEQRLDDIQAALDLLHKTGWSWADVRGAIGVPHMGSGSLFLSAEATPGELRPAVVGGEHVMTTNLTSHAARMLARHGFKDTMVEQAKQPSIAIALGLLAREMNVMPEAHAILDRMMAQIWQRPAPLGVKHHGKAA